MNTITISKKEYGKLIEVKLRYDYLRQIIKNDIFSSPPTKNAQEALLAFKQTNLYSPKFMKSLEKGLKRSVYFK